MNKETLTGTGLGLWSVEAGTKWYEIIRAFVFFLLLLLLLLRRQFFLSLSPAVRGGGVWKMENDGRI